MKKLFLILPLLSAFATANAQHMFHRLEGGSVSVGATGNFDTMLTSDPQPYSFNYPVVPFNNATETISGQQQYTTLSTGFVTKIQFHPVPYAGMELNYGFTHYSERYAYNTASTSAGAGAARVSIPTSAHEFTAAYIIHPKHIPFQPYVGIGGGAIDFNSVDNQFRGAGLLEAGFDIPVKHTRAGFRIGGRSLYYRSPNFDSPVISTRSWRVTSEPEVSSYYRF